MDVVRGRAKHGIRDAERIVEVGRFPVLGPDIVDLIVAFCVCYVHLTRSDAHNRAILLVQLFDLEIVATMVVGLVELRDGWKEGTWDFRQWVEEPAKRAFDCDVSDDSSNQKVPLLAHQHAAERCDGHCWVEGGCGTVSTRNPPT